MCRQFRGLTGTWEVITEAVLENVSWMTINPYVKSLSCSSYGRLQTREAHSKNREVKPQFSKETLRRASSHSKSPGSDSVIPECRNNILSATSDPESVILRNYGKVKPWAQLQFPEKQERGKATHSSILVWRIPWTEEPGGLQFMELWRVGHDWATNTHTWIDLLRTLLWMSKYAY